jgi:dTDP-glucose pyrophosphorylase/DNA-binding MarR family transcriptional regulator
MQLLNEVAQTPYATQRDLAKRIGVALGLTNLTLRRLSTKGCIRKTGTEKHRVRYLITPQGLSEKSRLANEYVTHSLQYYRGVRQFLRQHLYALAAQGHRRVVLYGLGELAEIVYFTACEMGLSVTAVIRDRDEAESFLGLPIHNLAETPRLEFDRLLVATDAQDRREVRKQLMELGVPAYKIFSVPEDVSQPPLAEEGDSFPRQEAENLPVLMPAATDVVILCGGRGTRLGHLTQSIPKPLLPIGGKPFLLRLMLHLREEGFGRFILAAHYLADQFQDFLLKYRSELPEVKLVIEPEPLGTGGALRHATDHVKSHTFVAINGDSWVTQPLAPVLLAHGQAGRIFTVVAVGARQVEGGANQKGVWRLGPEGQVAGFATQGSTHRGWVNAGVYLLDRTMVSAWPVGRYGLEDNLTTLLKGRRAGVFCSSGRLVDIGTPEVYHRSVKLLDSFGPVAVPAGGNGLDGR